jgi:hypothetical protein
MNSEGKAAADKALTQIDPGAFRGTRATTTAFRCSNHGISVISPAADDTTNTWDALKAAWATSRDSALSDYDNVNILLLTDGEPSPLTVPPCGIASALRVLMSEQPSRATISAFGFGYQMNSELLLQIAQAGNGAFAYIPDASMVGTVFCHAVSNAFAMAHFNCSLSIAVHGVRDASLLQCCLPAERLLTDDGVIMRVPMGHLQPGQKRSLLCRLSLLSTSDDAPFSVQVRSPAVLSFCAASVVPHQACAGCSHLRKCRTRCHVVL